MLTEEVLLLIPATAAVAGMPDKPFRPRVYRVTEGADGSGVWGAEKVAGVLLSESKEIE